MLKALAFVLLSIFTAKYLWPRKKLGKLPPGPPKLPLLDNLFNIPTSVEWKAFADLGEQHNTDIVHLSALGTSIVVLNSYQAAQDLLDHRSGIYSGRPISTMRNGLSGYNVLFGFLPYGSKWRESRKMFTRHFSEFTKTPVNQPREIYYIRRFLGRLLTQPDEFRELTHGLLGGITFSMTYGVRPLEVNDPYLAMAVEAEKNLHRTARTFLVDFLPILKYVPEWVPGAGWKKIAKECQTTITQSRDVLLEVGKKAMETSDYTPSFISEALKDLDEETGKRVDEHLVSDVATMVYYAALDTSASVIASFFMAMAIHPEVQRKAQLEVDQLLKGRLPEHEDLEKLPYITALVWELLRWKPAVPLGVPHAVTMDDVYNGYHVPKDSIVLANQWAMLHDPNDFPDPSVFKPERYLTKDGQLDTLVRDPSAIIFGFGRRICPGRHIALSIVKLTVASVLATFDITRKIGSDGRVIEVSQEFTAGIVIHPKEFECSIKPRSRDAVVCIDAWMSVEGDSPP